MINAVDREPKECIHHCGGRCSSPEAKSAFDQAWMKARDKAEFLFDLLHVEKLAPNQAETVLSDPIKREEEVAALIKIPEEDKFVKYTPQGDVTCKLSLNTNWSLYPGVANRWGAMYRAQLQCPLNPQSAGYNPRHLQPTNNESKPSLPSLVRL